jgi:hypothetical protein
MNVLGVGFNKSISHFFNAICEWDQHQLTLCDDGKMAVSTLQSNRNWDWVLISGLDKKPDHKEVVCALRLLKVDAQVLVFTHDFKVDTQATALCSIEQTSGGANIVHCAMHNLLADKKSYTKNKNMPVILEYQMPDIKKTIN